MIVVDAPTTAAGGKELLEDIAKITPKPVTMVILTHSDGEHVNGFFSGGHHDHRSRKRVEPDERADRPGSADPVGGLAQ